MNETKQWYAVYTKPRWEKKTAYLLEKKQIENYCPLNKVVRQWSDRKKTVLEPLFKSYVFIYASESEHLAVKQTDGVLNFVYWLGKPAIIKEDEIEIIRKFLDEHENIKIEHISVNIKDTVRILSGPLTMMEGEIIELRNQSVKILLPSLGFAMVAEVQKVNVEVINATKSRQNLNNFYNTSLG